MGFPQGSALDSVAQLLRPSMERKLRAPIALEYQIGAGGGIASAYVAKARPDGYTILLAPTRSPDATLIPVAVLNERPSTTAEASVSGAGAPILLALFAPKGVDPDVAEKFSLAAREVLETPTIREKLVNLGFALRNETIEASRAAVEGRSRLPETTPRPLARSRASFKQSAKVVPTPSLVLPPVFSPY